MAGASSAAWSMPRASAGATPTAGSGRCGASRATSSTPRRFWAAIHRGIEAAEETGSTDAISPGGGRPAPRSGLPSSSTGWIRPRDCFVQAYGSREVDASLLPPAAGGLRRGRAPRACAATTRAILDDLHRDGLLVRRYRPEQASDGALGGGEGAFLMASFWLRRCPRHAGRAPPQAEAPVPSASSASATTWASSRRSTTPSAPRAPRQLPAGVHPHGAHQLRWPPATRPYFQDPGGGTRAARGPGGRPESGKHAPSRREEAGPRPAVSPSEADGSGDVAECRAHLADHQGESATGRRPMVFRTVGDSP